MIWVPPVLAAPPSIDTPLRTGAKSPGDAAVVIGIERYPLLGRDVPFAEADARVVADSFTYTRGIPLGRILLLTGETTREDIVAAVKDLGAQVGAGGTLFVYFAGHGAAFGQARTLLGADVKSSADSFGARGVATTEISRLGAAGGGRVVMLVDACFGGAGRDGLELLPGTRWAVPVEPDAGQWAATAENQAAAPLTEAGHGLFTYLAVGAMRGWADGELSGTRDGAVTADEAQAWVVSALRTMGRTKQTPKLSADLDGFMLTHGVVETVDLAALTAFRPTSPAATTAPPAPAAAAARPVAAAASGSGFGDLNLDVSAKVRQQACDQEALRLGEATREARLRAEADRAAGEARSAWSKLSAQAKACESLDAASRLDCARTVDAYIARAEALVISLPAGIEAVTTSCGPATPAFEAEALVVAVADLAEAEAQAVRLKAPRTTPAPVVARASVAPRPSAPIRSGIEDQGSPGLGDEVVVLAAGSFQMGSPSTERGRDSDETPHGVRVSAFAIGRTEVTQALWVAVMGQNPAAPELAGVALQGGALPVQNISWCEAIEFANRLSTLQGLDEAYAGVAECAGSKGASVEYRREAKGWRLPTEAEWEYVARGGSAGAWGPVTLEAGVCEIGNVADQAAKRRWSAWIAHACDDGEEGLAPVGSFQANAAGVHDLTGNVWEWVWDGYAAYPSGSVTDPTGPASATSRVRRGGSWTGEPSDTRVADRIGDSPGGRGYTVGLRLARSMP